MNRVTLNLNPSTRERIDEQTEELLNDVQNMERSATEEVNNIGDINTVSNLLSDIGGEGAARSYNSYQSLISRTNEIELDALSLPFHISNITWEQFCERHPTFDIVDPGVDQELTEDLLLISETNSYHDKARLITVKNKIKYNDEDIRYSSMPYIEDANYNKV